MTESESGEDKRVRQALAWVERTLRADGGPHAGASAVMVIRAVPVHEQPGSAFLQVVCLPDIDHAALAEAVRRWAEDLAAGNIEQQPHGLDSEPEEGSSSGTIQ